MLGLNLGSLLIIFPTEGIGLLLRAPNKKKNKSKRDGDVWTEK